MKKIFAVLALVGVMASCKDKKADKKVEETTVVTGDTTTTPTTTTTTDPVPTTTSTSVPKFADADVQKYVDEYAAYTAAVVEAYKSKSTAKAQELAAKATEWSTKSQDIAMKLSTTPGDAQKFSDYIMAKSKEMTDAMMMK